MMPLMPGITTSRDAIGRTIDAIQASGLRLAGASVARLDPGVREFFLEFLDRCYPELSAGYRRLYRATRAPEAYLRQVRAVIDRAKHRRPSSV
jgi:DNA repair photolyase